MVKKRLVLLGATGSIGLSVLKVISEHPESFEIVLASAHNNEQELFRIAEKYLIPTVVLTGKQFNDFVRSAEITSNRKIKKQRFKYRLYKGEDDLLKLLRDGDYDLALNAISGSAGLKSTLQILKKGKTLALANKESLVMAGHLVKELTARHGSKILPVDSEHSAVFQAIGDSPMSAVRKIHLTASGGAFRNLPLSDFDKITPAQALKHPNWDMGAKVTLDSATMFNKALEVMEAHWLFDADYAQINAVIHPQSVIHSMVEFIDGSLIAQMSQPDMVLPILYALSYPYRLPSALVQTDLLALGQLSFQEIEKARYPLYYLGVEAGKTGGLYPTIANAANEAALKLFLEGKIPFTGIYRTVETALSKVNNITNPDLTTILNANTETYRQIIG